MRSFITAFHNIRRSPYQSLTAILMMSLVFFMSSIMVVFLLGAGQIISYFESRPQVIAFFSTSAASADIEAATILMQSKPYVEKVKVVSKEDALKLYREDNKNDPVLLELVTADIFPASIEVSAKEITALPRIRDDLKMLPEVEDVMYQKDVIDSLTSIISNVRIVGIIIVSFLLLMSLMFVIVVLSLRIAIKRQEIGIMRLLGAGVGYIVLPYMVEGMIYGMVGAILGWLGMFILYLYTTPFLVTFFGSIIHFPVDPLVFIGILAGGTITGMLIGLIASFVAVKRFVKK